MLKETFHQRLVKATAYSFTFAKRFIHNQLPESVGYHIWLKPPSDSSRLRPGEQMFTQDVANYGVRVGPLAVEQVVELLWRCNLVPEWIDVSVERTDSTRTFIRLLCCARFTDREEHFHDSNTGVYPFWFNHPYPPLGWSEGDKPFDLNWKMSRFR